MSRVSLVRGRRAGRSVEVRAGLRRAGRTFALLGAAWAVLMPVPSRAADPIRLRIVGGLAGVTQFTQLEQPFWQHEVARLTGGRVAATIHPSDGSGLRGQEMLQLMQLGVAPFGTASLSAAAADEPAFELPDLPALNPDMASLRAHVGQYREHLRQLLRGRRGLELLAVYVYPAQVVFCTKAFRGLRDLAGRRVRTASVGQSELVDGLGAISVKLPFAGLAGAMRDGVVDCAITGAKSAIENGLSDVATHVGDRAINWGVSLFAANLQAWEALPPEIRASLRDGIGELETRIWDRAELDTAQGLACNIGSRDCPASERKALVLVRDRDDADGGRKLLTEQVLPRWVDRCGAECTEAWNRLVGPAFDIRLGSR